jgi:propionate catabolism operon transcriptional regulator
MEGGAIMSERKFRLGVVASKGSLLQEVKRILAEEGHELSVSVRSLDDAIPAGKKMEAEGVEAIISWRGTAYLLRENLQIPVLAIPQTAMDILSALRHSSRLGKKILLPVFRRDLGDLGIMEELLNIRIIQGIYYDRASLESLIYHSREQGCEVVIGGRRTLEFARKYGLEGVEAEMSPEAIGSTIDNAKAVIKSRRDEQEKTERYRCIIDSVSEGVIALDEEGRITIINKAAQDYLNRREDDLLGKPVTDVMASSSWERVLKTRSPLMDNVEKIGPEAFVFNHIPVTIGNHLIGGVSTFRDISHVMRVENKVRRTLTRGLTAKYRLADLLYQSRAMEDATTRVRRFAGTDSTILIIGETGTGKELIAQSIHHLSRRNRFPFVSLNCAALPEQLLESELFGYEEGAFTGSKKGGKPGLFEMAHLGTLFLDEVAAMPATVQVRLLRVLQEREVMRLGGDRVIPVDVRILAAANKDLEEEVLAGRFREDLFFRLNVLPIPVPPLRRRPEDIPLLAAFFIKKYSLALNLSPLELAPDCLERLCQYSWPGNVRQLQNFCERLVLLSHSSFDREIFSELYAELAKYPAGSRPSLAEASSGISKTNVKILKRDVETSVIKKALEQSQFSRAGAAKLLGVSRTTLWKKMKEMS